MEMDQGAWRKRWSTIAWWIVTIHSVPFAIYTVPFIYGKFEIFRYLTPGASFGLESAGLNVLNNLRTWQIHAAAALAFVVIGPIQFNSSFRNKHPLAHKRLGYAFAACTIITAVTGGTSLMLRATELGPISVAMAPVMSVSTLVALAISIDAARNKDFGRHRRWMLRSAAIGYSVMYTRTLPMLFRWTSLPPDKVLDYCFPLSLALNSGLAELYIQIFLSESRVLAKSMGGDENSPLVDSSSVKEVR